MPITIENEKWIIYRHTNNIDIITATAANLKTFSKTFIDRENKESLMMKLRSLNYYKEKNPEMPLDGINHNINTLAYYMFGYKSDDDGKKFIFSPLGNLFLKYLADSNKSMKIFTTMLWGLQFPHPHSSTPHSFNLFPFRKMFKLLTDARLDNKLYTPEAAYLVMQVKEFSEQNYNSLVDRILVFRKKSIDEKKAIFMSNSHLYVNSAYEWSYITTLFSSLKIINRPGWSSSEEICRLAHPNRNGKKPTVRVVKNNYIEISEENKEYVEKLLNTYNCFDNPITLDSPNRLYIDIVKEIYSFYPRLLMEKIGESDELTKCLELPKLIEEYSNNPENDTAYKFEEVLTEGFEMFANVDAKRRGGAGHTDIECLYITKKKKFAVESKSTANKLIGINAGRLRQQREEIGGEYTIVITPRYVPATRRDIKGTPIVIVLANTFAEYLYNNIFNDIRDIDYADFDDIIVNHLGEDVSKLISDMTLNKFAANS